MDASLRAAARRRDIGKLQLIRFSFDGTITVIVPSEAPEEGILCVQKTCKSKAWIPLSQV